jgi:hypothetical protein
MTLGDLINRLLDYQDEKFIDSDSTVYMKKVINDVTVSREVTDVHSDFNGDIYIVCDE